MRSSLSTLALLALAATAAAQQNRWVSPSGSDGNPGTQALPFLTINHANAVSNAGDVIRLLPGTYGDEQGSIVLGQKDIAVVGSGIGTTIVRAHSTLTTNVPTGFPNAPVPTQQRPVILVQGSARVDLRGFTVDGNFALPANGRLTGIYYRAGADGVVSDLTVRNCRAQPLDGSQGPAGLVVRGDGSGDTCEVVVRNCDVTQWGKVGIAAFFDAELQVEDCRIVGADHTQSGPAQNGIQFGYGAGGAVRRSTIADVFYDPAGYVAAGILCYDAGGSLSLEDNALANCEHGIYAYSSSGGALPGTIRRNRVVACDAGVYLDSITGLLVEDNHLQLSLDLYANAGFSNLPGNTWSGNCYSSYSGAGSHPIPGGGGAVDSTPRRGVDLLSAPVATALPAGHVPRHLAVAELDGQPGSDFATVDENAGVSLSIGKNVGGAFVLASVPFAATGRPVAIVAAELNNAPGLDLAVLLQVTTPVAGARVYTFANDGAGNFAQLGAPLAIGSSLPTALAAGDVTGDGIAELVYSNVGTFGGGDAILLGNPGPVFGTNYTVAVLPSFGYYTTAVRGVAIADVTGDGLRDVLATEGNQSMGRLHVLANNGFGFAPTGYSPLYVPNDPTGVAVGDLDGDGDQDLLVSYGTSVNSAKGGVAVLEGQGGGMFRTSFYNTDFSTNTVVVGNLDDDSDPDSVSGDCAIVNTDGGTITVLGDFARGAGFRHGGIAVNGTPASACAFGDFDGDQFQDLFYSTGFSGTVVVRPGRPSARSDHFGFGTEGYRGRVPYVAPVGAPGVPTQPNSTLGIELQNGKPSSLGALVCSFAPAPVLLPASLQVDLSQTLLTYLALTDLDGRFVLPFTLPAGPSLHGLPLYWQGGVLDGVGGLLLFPGVAVSTGLKTRIGY
jgi:hypothetical protein